MERGRKMTENSYKTRCGCIHYFVNLIDKQKITLVFLPGLTADHRLFEKQTEYLEKKQNVLPVLVTECLLRRSKRISHIVSVVRHYLSVEKRIKRDLQKVIIRNGIRGKVYRLNG